MKKLSLPIFSASAAIFAVISLILRVISLFNYHDELGYYELGAILPIIANIFSVLAIALFTVGAILCIKPSEKIAPPDKLSKYAAWLPLSALVFVLVSLFKDFTVPAPENTAIFELYFIPLITLLGALLAIVFFFLIFYSKASKTVTVYFGLGALVFLFFCWLSVYFDFSSPLNSAQRTLLYITCAAATLFVFNEITAIYGSVKPKFYYFSVFTLIFSVASSSIPSIIYSICNPSSSYATLREDIFFTALLIYAGVRLIGLLSKSKKTTAPEQTKNTDVNENQENTDNKGE